MKVKIIDDNNIIVFLNSLNIKNIDFDNRENIEKNFRNIFLKLKHIYDIDVEGYYNINIYKDISYGAVLEIEHENIDYFDYLDKTIDMRVNVISNTKFLYKLYDILKLDKKTLDKAKLFSFKNEYYLFLKEISFYELGILIENSDLIYGSIVDEILKFGKEINIRIW